MELPSTANRGAAAKKTILTAVMLLSLALIGFAGVKVWQLGQAFLDSIRPRVEGLLGAALNARVSIEDLNVSFYPTLGLKAEKISLVFPASCLATVQAQAVILKLDHEALLHRRLQVKMLEIIGPAAALAIDSGKTTLEPLQSHSAENSQGDPAASVCDIQDPPPQVVPAAPSTSPTPLDFSLAIETIAVRDARLELHQGDIRHKLLLNELQADLDFSQDSLTLTSPALRGSFDQKPLDFKAETIDVHYKTGIVEFKRAESGFGKLRLTADGTLHEWFKPKKLRAASSSVDLSHLHTAIALHGGVDLPLLSKGSASFDINLSTDSLSQMSLTGRAAVTAMNLPAYHLSLDALSLEKFSLKISPNGEFALEAPLKLQGFALKDAADAYQVGSCAGTLSIRRDQSRRMKASGALSVTAFGFDDGTSKITEASADLSNITADISPALDVKVVLNTTGHSFNLDHEAVKIRGFSALKAPLKIEVPSKGGYSVSGPVSVLDASINTLNRDFSKVSADVQILVSGPLRRFSSGNLSATVAGRRVSAQSDFSMESSAFILKDSSLTIAPSTVKVHGRIDRNAARSFSLGLSGRDLMPGEIMPLVFPEKKDSMEGAVKSLELDLAGNLHHPLDSLAGKGSILITQPITKGFDLTAAVANAISVLPIIGSRIVPDKFKEEQSEHSAQASFTVSNRTVSSNDLVIKRSRFTLYAQGKINFNLELDAKGSVVFMQETFGSFGGGFESFGALLGRVGKIEVPLFIKGAYPNFSLTPDTVTFLKDNSGLTLLGDTLGAARDVGLGVGRIITSPFRGRGTPMPSPPPQT